MRFDDYRYLYPPRPDNAVPKTLLPSFTRRGWVAQTKKNGTCNVIAVAPDRTLRCMNRHAEAHKAWAPTAASSAAFKGLPGKGWYVFVAELLHSKVEGLRDTNYIHDILVEDGAYLVGTTFWERQNRLKALFATIEETTTHHVIDKHTWLARNHTDALTLYEGLTGADDEGVVVKDPNAKLALCSKATSNVAWQIKSRRIHKNFGF